MKSSVRHYFAAGFLLVSTLASFAGDIKIIANPSVKTTTISNDELRCIFLLQRRTLRDGSPVDPVLLKGGAANETFMKQYLKRDSEEIRIYYQGLVFTGKGSMPRQLDSDSEVVAYVARTKAAIGYVSSDTNTDAVRVLAITEDSIKQRKLLTRVEPDYPETLQRLGIGGSVRLELEISPKGAVESVTVLGGNPILAEAAVKAVKQWVYSASSSQTKIEVVVPFEPRH